MHYVKKRESILSNQKLDQRNQQKLLRILERKTRNIIDNNLKKAREQFEKDKHRIENKFGEYAYDEKLEELNKSLNVVENCVQQFY